MAGIIKQLLMDGVPVHDIVEQFEVAPGYVEAVKDGRLHEREEPAGSVVPILGGAVR